MSLSFKCHQNKHVFGLFLFVIVMNAEPCCLGSSLPAVCVQNNFSLPFPPSHTSSLEVAISHSVAPGEWVPLSQCLISPQLSNWPRCQAIQLNFQSVVTSLWLQRGAVVTVPPPKSPPDVLWPQHSTPWGSSLPSAPLAPPWDYSDKGTLDFFSRA